MNEIAEYSRKIMEDRESKKGSAILSLIQSNFHTMDEARKFICIERQGEYEYIKYNGRRVWRIKTVYEDLTVRNESEWITPATTI